MTQDTDQNEVASERRVIYGGDWIYLKDIAYIRSHFGIPLEWEARPSRQYGPGASFSYLADQMLAMGVEIEPIKQWLEVFGQPLPHQIVEAEGEGEADAEKEAQRRYRKLRLKAEKRAN